MSRRIIIENRSNLDDIEALRRVGLVINGGRVSNGGIQYCYLTTFDDDIQISTDYNKSSDRFIVCGGVA
jgi:hypothetical protein